MAEKPQKSVAEKMAETSDSSLAENCSGKLDQKFAEYKPERMREHFAEQYGEKPVTSFPSHVTITAPEGNYRDEVDSTPFRDRSGLSSDQLASTEPVAFRSMDTNEFMLYRKRTSVMFGLPSQFFEERPELRRWGVEQLCDPMVQPYDPQKHWHPKPFHTTLPGYTEKQCKGAIRNPGCESMQFPSLGPDISVFPPTWTPHFPITPDFVPQQIGYEWDKQGYFQMDRLPYVNAFFQPKDPQATNMYGQMVPWSAYPYGVPLV